MRSVSVMRVAGGREWLVLGSYQSSLRGEARLGKALHHGTALAMEAATLLAFGFPLSIAAVPDPVPGTGEVVVDVMATDILPYTADVFSGARRCAHTAGPC